MHSPRRPHRQLLRVGAWLATSSLCLTTLAPASAQPAAPPGAEQAGDQGTDPPALAGRLASMTGTVSFHAAGETQWNAATLNYPVTTGLSFWTEPQASATLEVADNRLVLDDSTELDVTALDQTQLDATEAQGALFLQLNSVPNGQGVSVNTPRGTVQISAVGRYEIVAGDTNDATSITVVEGAAHVTGNNLALDIGPNQTATIGGADVLQGSVGPMQQDAFLQNQLREPVRRVAANLPRQVRYMTGSADLQQYGSFTQTAQYGQVWYPNDVARDWAPYREGHWAYVHPWGWTWVDNARWGFAPFHYGRWIQDGGRWGWVAGDGQVGGGDEGGYGEASPYPVYSPALVSFVDVSGAALAGVAIGFGAAELVGGYAPAWIPLGPREPYYPWYHVRPDYFARMNSPYGVPRDIIQRGPIYNTTNITNIHNTTVVNNRITYINRGAATVVPAAAFARGQSMTGFARPLPERALVDARPVVGRLPVRPTAFTPNLPAAAARRYDVALPRTPVQPATTGPRILPQPAVGRGVPPVRVAPPLRVAAPPGNIHAIPAAGVQGRPAGAIPPGGVRQPGAPRPIAPAPSPAPAPAPAGSRPAVPGQGIHNPGGPGVGAPGPQPGAHGPGGLPALRAPGARPPALVPGAAGPGGLNRAPGSVVDRPAPPPGAATRPGLAPRADAPRPALPRPQAPGFAPSPQPRPALPTLRAGPRPVPAPRIEAPRPAPMQAPRPPRIATPQPAPHVARPAPVVAPRPAPPPRVEAPRPPPRFEAPRPPPRVEAPRPPPRVEAPRSPPRMEAPRPPPRMEAPRPPPRMEAPRPPPPRQAPPPPRPAPAPHAAPPGKPPN